MTPIAVREVKEIQLDLIRQGDKFSCGHDFPGETFFDFARVYVRGLAKQNFLAWTSF